MTKNRDFIYHSTPTQLATLLIYDQDFKMEMVDAMRRYAGSFVQALAECISRADMTNLRKLVETFPEYCKEYAVWNLPKEKSVLLGTRADTIIIDEIKEREKGYEHTNQDDNEL